MTRKRTREPGWQTLTSAVCRSHACLLLPCLPELVQVPPLSQSRKCTFQASCLCIKGSRHVSERLTSSSHNCCWICILIGRWESGGNFTCCSFLAWSPTRLKNMTGDLWTEVMSCWLVNHFATFYPSIIIKKPSINQPCQSQYLPPPLDASTI